MVTIPFSPASTVLPLTVFTSGTGFATIVNASDIFVHPSFTTSNVQLLDCATSTSA